MSAETRLKVETPCGLPLRPTVRRNWASRAATLPTSSDVSVFDATSICEPHGEECSARTAFGAYLSRMCSSAQAKPCALLGYAFVSAFPELATLAGMLAAEFEPCVTDCSMKPHRSGSTTISVVFLNAPTFCISNVQSA